MSFFCACVYDKDTTNTDIDIYILNVLKQNSKNGY